MNPFFFRETKDASKWLEIDFDEVQDKSANSIAKSGIRLITVNDSEYNDRYEISLQMTNLGVNGMCFLNGRCSYQADFLELRNVSLKEVINNIAGGIVLA